MRKEKYLYLRNISIILKKKIFRFANYRSHFEIKLQFAQ